MVAQGRCAEGVVDEASLPGPSRTIIVEPIHRPAERPSVSPPDPTPAERPDRERDPVREPVPAR